MDRALALIARLSAFVVRDFRETASYRLAFAMQFYGVFFSVTLFYFIARIFSQAAVPALERYSTNYFGFVLIGLALAGFQMTGMGVFAGSIRSGQVTGTLEAMLVTPTSLTFIVVASATWAYLRSTFGIVLYFAVGALYGFRLPAADWPAALLVWALSVTAFSALGVLSASFVLAFKKGNPATALIGSVSSLLSGVFFPVELLPEWLHHAARFLPLTHALEGMRRALLGGEGAVAIGRELGALALFSAVLMPIAVFSFRMAVRHAKREGSLAQY